MRSVDNDSGVGHKKRASQCDFIYFYMKIFRFSGFTKKIHFLLWKSSIKNKQNYIFIRFVNMIRWFFRKISIFFSKSGKYFTFFHFSQWLFDGWPEFLMFWKKEMLLLNSDSISIYKIRSQTGQIENTAILYLFTKYRPRLAGKKRLQNVVFVNKILLT